MARHRPAAPSRPPHAAPARLPCWLPPPSTVWSPPSTARPPASHAQGPPPPAHPGSCCCCRRGRTGQARAAGAGLTAADGRSHRGRVRVLEAGALRVLLQLHGMWRAIAIRAPPVGPRPAGRPDPGCKSRYLARRLCPYRRRLCASPPSRARAIRAPAVCISLYPRTRTRRLYPYSQPPSSLYPRPPDVHRIVLLPLTCATHPCRLPAPDPGPGPGPAHQGRRPPAGRPPHQGPLVALPARAKPANVLKPEPLPQRRARLCSCPALPTASVPRQSVPSPWHASPAPWGPLAADASRCLGGVPCRRAAACSPALPVLGPPPCLPRSPAPLPAVTVGQPGHGSWPWASSSPPCHGRHRPCPCRGPAASPPARLAEPTMGRPIKLAGASLARGQTGSHLSLLGSASIAALGHVVEALGARRS